MADFEIWQGENDPVIIDFTDTITDSIDIHVGIYSSNGEELLHWEKDDITITSKRASCPLSQSDSASLPKGAVYLETKRTNASGRVVHYPRKTGTVLDRFDLHVLMEEIATTTSEVTE